MQSQQKPVSHIRVGNTTVLVEVADTENSREQGLSGRGFLLSGHGMLFIFDSPVIPGFWMKGMRFSLDILFADKNGTIVTIDTNLSPSTYLQQPPEVFYPSAPVMYVLEVPEGFAAQNGIAVGQMMHIK